MIAALIVPKTVDELIGYWKANANLLDWAKKIRPQIHEQVRLAFANRKKELQGEING